MSAASEAKADRPASKDALDEATWLAQKAQEAAAPRGPGTSPDHPLAVERLATAIMMLAGELRELRAAHGALAQEAGPLRDEVRGLREEVASLRRDMDGLRGQVGQHDGELMMHRRIGPGLRPPEEVAENVLAAIKEKAEELRKAGGLPGITARDPRAVHGGGFGE